MPTPLPFDDLPGSQRARRFEGAEHGASVSFFLNRHAAGEGPKLHVHPYEETFIVQGGSATFTVGGETIEASAGHILIVPPKTPHKFVNSGDSRLQLVSIHAAASMVQEDLE
jgi:mannose-6-phosphate isomerase-like protein (cupin superfamily)